MNLLKPFYKDLDLDAFTNELERQGFGNKSISLDDIRSELNHRYRDGRIPFKPPSLEEISNEDSQDTSSDSSSQSDEDSQDSSSETSSQSDDKVLNVTNFLFLFFFIQFFKPCSTLFSRLVCCAIPILNLPIQKSIQPN